MSNHQIFKLAETEPSSTKFSQNITERSERSAKFKRGTPCERCVMSTGTTNN